MIPPSASPEDLAFAVTAETGHTFTPAATLGEWISRVRRREVRVGIAGLGYVGLPLTLLFSEERICVTGFDVDASKVAALNEGRSYIHRIETEHIMGARRSGFTATSDFSAVAGLDVVLICVPTPLYDDHTPDMRFVTATIESIAPHLRAGQMVVLESTTYPGTTEEIIVETIERHGKPRGLKVLRGDAMDAGLPLNGVLVAFSPEREDPGNLTTSRRDIPKVVGGVSLAATEAASALYGAIFRQTVPVSSPAVAEMTKLLENIYRSVNIALVNELKQLCQTMGIDIWEVIDAASTKPFGFQAFYPGPGVGGHCIPVDPFYLSWKARQFGVATKFIELAGEVNEAMPQYVVDCTAKALGRMYGTPLKGAKLLVLGLAYKRDVDDLRESPALSVIERLQKAGAHVAYSDPFFPEVGHGRHYDLHLHSVPLDRDEDYEAVADYDGVILITDHSLYDMECLVKHARLVVDSRHATRGIVSEKIVYC